MKRIISGLALMFIFASAIQGAEKVHVTVSIPPQAFLVRHIAGDAVELNVMVPDGKSPHDYAPTPLQVKNVTSSVAYFLIGHMPFEEELTAKLRNIPGLKLIPTGTSIDLISGTPCEHCHEGEENDADQHDGHEHHHHEAGGIDPHVWMSPANLKIMADNMLPELQRLCPDKAELFKNNCRKLDEIFDALDRKIAARLEPFKGRAVYVYHPAFGYFCDRYGLKQVAIEEGGKDPTPKQIMELIADAKRDKVKVILVQKQFNSRSAAKIGEAIGGRVVQIDNLERDVTAMLENLSEQIAIGLGGK